MTDASSNATPIEEVVRLAREQYKLETDIRAMETELKQKQQQLRELSERLLPDAMDVADVQGLTLSNGWSLSLTPQLHASIPKEAREEAYRWLRAHGHGALLKRELSLSFPRDNDAEVTAMEAAIEQLATDMGLRSIMKLEDTVTVHPGTLKSWVREQLEQGTDLPLATFGVYQRRVASLQSPDKE